MKGEYVLNKSKNNIILYCKVILEIIDYPNEKYGLSLELLDDIEVYNAQYIIAIKGGIEYFREVFPKKHFGKTIIKVTSFSAREIDTGYMVVFYSVVRALCDAYKISDEKLNFNENDFSFTFSAR
jgi:hypothetical protein